MKNNIQQLNITLSPGIIKKIKDGSYNRNQLLISLLRKYIEKNKK